MPTNHPDSHGYNRAEAIYSNEISSRIDQLRQKYSNPEIHYPCYCELFSQICRIFDLSKLLGTTNILKFESVLSDALEQYQSDNDIKPALNLLSTLNKLNLNLEQPRNISTENHKIQIFNKSKDYRIHLVIPFNFNKISNHGIHSIEYQLSLHNSPLELIDAISDDMQHIILIDENICKDYKIDVFEFINNHYCSNCKYIIYSNDINVEKRIKAIRIDAILVHTEEYSDELIIRSIEKCLSNEKNKNILIFSNDHVLSKYITRISLPFNASIDLIDTISNELFIKLRKIDYDLILIDSLLYSMPASDLAKIIRLDDFTAQIPIAYLGDIPDFNCHLHPYSIYADCHIIRLHNAHVIQESILKLLELSTKNRISFELTTNMLRNYLNYRRAIDAHSIISVTNLKGVIIDVNQKFIEISGYEREELIGKFHNIINSGIHPKHFFIEMWRTISSGKKWQGEICNRKKNGSLYWVEATIVPCLDEKGKPYQYVSARTEITRQKQIEEQLRTSENRLTRSQSFANIGTWDWDIVNNILYWSNSTPPLFGYAACETYISHQNFINAIHPDDKESVIEALNNSLNNNLEYKIQYRCIWPDGTVHWILDKGDIIRNHDNTPLHMLGVVMDITEQKLIEDNNSQQKILLDILRTGLSWFLQDHDISHIAHYMLENLLQLTQSKFGIIGAIKFDNLNKPYLKTHSITNISWDEKSINFYKQHYKSGLEFHNQNNLIGEVFKTGKPVISNNPINDPRKGGLPNGHPELTSYLGVPVFHGDNLVAMYCLANRKDGYNDEIINFLNPFNVAYSSIMHAMDVIRIQHETLIELENSRNLAIEANKAKSQFLSSMSHELRTPLNAILGFSQLLEMNHDRNLNPSQLDNVSEILKAGRHLLQLINQILDLSKLESGKVDLFLEPITAASVISDCVEIVRPLANSKNITINWQYNNSHSDYAYLKNIILKADRLRTKQIILNFLSNSVKYNKYNGVINISLSIYNTNFVRICVSDSGKGIPYDKQKRLFIAFDRLDEKDFDSEGTGIGLVISKNLAELMNGTIGFRSDEHIGSEFWVDLPRSLETENNNVISNTTNINTNVTINENIIKKKIIYIEDNPTNLRLVESIFRHINNFELLSAQDAYLGYQLIKLHKPDLVLLDINMPGMNGYELLAKIKNNDLISNIPVIAISANATDSDIDTGIKAGFDDYITKPIVIDQLVNAIHRLLN